MDRLGEADPEKLVLPPDQVIEVPLSFIPHVEDVGKKLKVNLSSEKINCFFDLSIFFVDIIYNSIHLSAFFNFLFDLS